MVMIAAITIAWSRRPIALKAVSVIADPFGVTLCD